MGSYIVNLTLKQPQTSPHINAFCMTLCSTVTNFAWGNKLNTCKKWKKLAWNHVDQKWCFWMLLLYDLCFKWLSLHCNCQSRTLLCLMNVKSFLFSCRCPHTRPPTPCCPHVEEKGLTCLFVFVWRFLCFCHGGAGTTLFLTKYKWFFNVCLFKTLIKHC